MRSSLVFLLVLGACAVDGEAPPIDSAPEVEIVSVGTAMPQEVDVCALAAELPLHDICSLICDPPAMAARLVDDGNERGRCYQLYCALPGDEHVLVGICLPP